MGNKATKGTSKAIKVAAKAASVLPTKDFREPQEVKAILLSTYLSEFYSNNVEAFAEELGHSKDEVDSWLSKDAVLAGGHICLKASKFKESEEESLERKNNLDEGLKVKTLALVISESYLSQGDFARQNKTFQQQVSRWIDRGTLYIEGQVYRAQAVLNKKKKGTKKNNK